MPEKFVFDDHRKTFAQWAFVAAISALDDPKLPTSEDGSYEIDLKINGVQVPFLQIIRRLDQEREWLVAQEAAKLVDERIIEMQIGTEAVVRGFARAVRGMFPELKFSDEE